MDEEMDAGTAEAKKESPEAVMAEEASVESTVESKSTTATINYKKWKNKAKQQLESIEDLVSILKDSTLDIDFKQEIEKELDVLYETRDSASYDLDGHELKFKNFKDLKVESQDTLSLLFKNKKDNLKAAFIVVSETKLFGESTEIVERLKLVSISKIE